MPVFRIRMISGHEGRPNFYHHADVIARDGQVALRAAKKGRVHNWRWLDTFDTASKTYYEYRLLYPLPLESAERPEPPHPMRLWRLEQRLLKLDGVYHARVWNDNCDVWVRRDHHRSGKFYRAVRAIVSGRRIRYIPRIKKS